MPWLSGHLHATLLSLWILWFIVSIISLFYLMKPLLSWLLLNTVASCAPLCGDSRIRSPTGCHLMLPLSPTGAKSKWTSEGSMSRQRMREAGAPVLGACSRSWYDVGMQHGESPSPSIPISLKFPPETWVPPAPYC